MGRRATFPKSIIAQAEATALRGLRVTLRIEGAEMVVEPPGGAIASPDTAESALEAWLGGRDERPA